MTLQTGDGKWHYSKTFPSAFFFLNSAYLYFVKNQRTFTIEVIMHLYFTQQAFKMDICNRVLIAHVDIGKGYIDYQISQKSCFSIIFRIDFQIESNLRKNHILCSYSLIFLVDLKKHYMFFLSFSFILFLLLKMVLKKKLCLSLT